MECVTIKVVSFAARNHLLRQRNDQIRALGIERCGVLVQQQQFPERSRSRIPIVPIGNQAGSPRANAIRPNPMDSLFSAAQTGVRRRRA